MDLERIEIDPVAVATDLLQGKHSFYQTFYEDQAKAVTNAISQVNENYVGHLETIGIRVKMPGYREVIGPNDERKLVESKRKVWTCCRGFSVHAELHPDILADALLNSIKEFGRENGIESIEVGKLIIDPNDDY